MASHRDRRGWLARHRYPTGPVSADRGDAAVAGAKTRWRHRRCGAACSAGAAANAPHIAVGSTACSKSPPPAATPAFRKNLREGDNRPRGAGGAWEHRRHRSLLRRGRAQARRFLDRSADARICTAAVCIAGRRGVYLAVARVRVPGQQLGRRHDLPGLAVSALRDVEVYPDSPLVALLTAALWPVAAFAKLYRRPRQLAPQPVLKAALRFRGNRPEGPL